MAEATIRLARMGLVPTQEVIDLPCDADCVARLDDAHPDVPVREAYQVDPRGIWPADPTASPAEAPARVPMSMPGLLRSGRPCRRRINPGSAVRPRHGHYAAPLYRGPGPWARVADWWRSVPWSIVFSLAISVVFFAYLAWEALR